MEKEFKIQVPKGYEIDKENSTFEYIKFKPIQPKRWRDNPEEYISGYYINTSSILRRGDCFSNTPRNYNIFATEKQAKSALVMARISQIMANDERFGGIISNREWDKGRMDKYIIIRNGNCVQNDCANYKYNFLAFHTFEQRNLFLEENEDLVKDYLMLD